MHPVLADLALLGRNKADSEPGVITGQERDAVVWIAGHLSPQEPGPEPRDTQRLTRIEADREQLTSHSLSISDPLPDRCRQGALSAHRTEAYG